MTTQEQVQIAAVTFDNAENYAREIKEGMRSMRKTFEVARDEGHIGGLEAQALACEVDVLATKFEADLYAVHDRLTQMAKDAEVDLPERSGGR